MAEPITAAGGVVYRLKKSGDVEYLLVHRPRYDDWTLPKGKLDEGETFKVAAEREVTEETSFKCVTEKKIGTIGYVTPNGNDKMVRYWLMRKVGGRFKPNDEVDEIRWLPSLQAYRALSYLRERTVLERANRYLADPTSGRIYLVRHAYAGKRSAWTKDDRARPLSKAGRKQVALLTDVLSEEPVIRILSSDYKRCINTVAPLGNLLMIDVEPERSLVEGASADDVLATIRELAHRPSVLCSHGDVIGATIGRLHAEGIPLSGGLRWDKGSVWLLQTSRGRVVTGRYMPAV